MDAILLLLMLLTWNLRIHFNFKNLLIFHLELLPLELLPLDLLPLDLLLLDLLLLDLLRTASFADLVRDLILCVLDLLIFLFIIILMFRNTTFFVSVSSESTIQLLS